MSTCSNPVDPYSSYGPLKVQGKDTWYIYTGWSQLFQIIANLPAIINQETFSRTFLNAFRISSHLTVSLSFLRA